MITKRFYVTTPIYYATAQPHLGTLYSTILADCAARWHAVQGQETFFLTGTDEHGQKVAQSAEKAGKDPKAFVDNFIGAYKDLWKQYNINYSHFIRTTDESHVKAVQKWIVDLQKKGDIYKGTYEGWYCTPCETYLTEKDYETGQENPACPSCERETTLVSEECYFFKLSKYQDKLLQFYKDNPDFITPKERAAEVVSFVKAGLQDLSISRTTISWGIPFPGDERHVTYVWADALNNYITALGYGDDAKQEQFKKWWPAQLQVLGKDIVRFHAVYWPAFLMAAGLEMPQKLLVHGWIKVGKHKMSKSRGNSVDPHELLAAYGADAVRYYLTRHMAVTQDGQFAQADLEQAIGSELANDLGNLLQRMSTLALKQGYKTIAAAQEWQQAEQELQQEQQAMLKTFTTEMERGYYHLALNAVWKFLHKSNAYFHAQQPWKLIKTDTQAFERSMSATCHALHAASVLLWPFMPEKMQELAQRIGTTLNEGNDYVSPLYGQWETTFSLTQGDPLFMKPEPQETTQQEVQKPEPSYIKIDDFVKVDIRVGIIKDAQEVDGSDKLLRLTVDVGEENTRTIFSGIKKSYAPEDLIGKQATFIVNLKPRKMMGTYSEGMMLATEKEDGGITIVTPSDSAVVGSRVS